MYKNLYLPGWVAPKTPLAVLTRFCTIDLSGNQEVSEECMHFVNIKYMI